MNEHNTPVKWESWYWMHDDRRSHIHIFTLTTDVDGKPLRGGDLIWFGSRYAECRWEERIEIPRCALIGLPSTRMLSFEKPEEMDWSRTILISRHHLLGVTSTLTLFDFLLNLFNCRSSAHRPTPFRCKSTQQTWRKRIVIITHSFIVNPTRPSYSYIYIVWTSWFGSRHEPTAAAALTNRPSKMPVVFCITLIIELLNNCVNWIYIFSVFNNDDDAFLFVTHILPYQLRSYTRLFMAFGVHFLYISFFFCSFMFFAPRKELPTSWGL